MILVRIGHGVMVTDVCDRLSANMAVATLNTGTLGGSMGLSFWDSFIVILIVNLFSDLIPAWTAAFGLTGLRMTTFSCVRHSLPP